MKIEEGICHKTECYKYANMVGSPTLQSATTSAASLMLDVLGMSGILMRNKEYNIFGYGNSTCVEIQPLFFALNNIQTSS